MENYQKILEECPLFAEIGRAELSSMLACMRAEVKSFPRGRDVWVEGAPAGQIGVVLTGAVQVYRVDFLGNRSLIFRLGRGEVFGEAFACAEVETVPVAVLAEEDAEILFLKASCVLHPCERHCGHHDRLIYNLMRDLAREALWFHERVEITSKRTTRNKLLAYLAHMRRETGSPSFSVPFDRQELADFLEVDRSGLSAEIGKLRREGVILCEKNRFTLL